MLSPARLVLPVLALAGAASIPSGAEAAALPTLGAGFEELQAVATEAAQPAVLAVAEVECMAKVVLHEAGSEPRDGKVAVAQTLTNRLAAGRFGASICAVANQRGQFFNTAAFHPNREGSAWADAVAVSRAVLAGAEAVVAPGAMFFRGAAHPASTFLRTRERVATVGAQVFYR